MTACRVCVRTILIDDDFQCVLWYVWCLSIWVLDVVRKEALNCDCSQGISSNRAMETDREVCRFEHRCVYNGLMHVGSRRKCIGRLQTRLCPDLYILCVSVAF